MPCKNTKFKKTLLLLSVACVAVSSQLWANKSQSYQQEIKKIASEIKSISRNLNSNKALLKTERDKLSGVEQEMSALKKEIAQLKRQIKTKNQLEKAQTKKIKELQQQQSANLQRLAKLINSRYQQGNPSLTKMILNQENPYAVGRLQNYYDYFSQAQQQEIEEVNESLAELNAVTQQRKTTLAELEQKQRQQTEQQQKLSKAREQRQKVITRLNTKVEKSSEKLKRLKQDRKRLNQLINQIAAKAAAIKKAEQQRQAEAKANTQSTTTRVTRIPVQGGFLKQRGRLKFPVKGKVKHNYGSRIAESGMRSQGILFSTNANQKINSIFSGRVIFADYLKGYGLLLIVDHGDDHISLYGHNEVLYKKVGDQVATNEVIATAGTSGGLKTPGLYFEIRHHTTPVDPRKWCQ